MLLFLHVVGLEIGLLWACLAWICNILNIPSMMKAMALCAFPFLVTGCIHLDGYMDVTDAGRKELKICITPSKTSAS